jgi:hypothetical protein
MHQIVIDRSLGLRLTATTPIANATIATATNSDLSRHWSRIVSFLIEADVFQQTSPPVRTTVK